MEKPNILITCPMSREYLAKLNADPRIAKAQQLPREMWPLFRQMYTGGIESTAGGPLEMGPYFAEADIIVCWGLPHGSVNWSPKLKWVQGWSAGVDYMKGSGVLESGIPLTTLSGGNAVPVAEHVLMMMLMLARDAKGFIENAHKRQWRAPHSSDVLSGSTVGIVGLGAIGSQVARMCHGFDMSVVAIRRSTTSRHRDAQGVDEIMPSSELPYLLEQSDFVVLSTPLSKETQGLIGEKELKTMKSTAFLINVSRGEVVNEPVLKQALKEKWIAGAGLDVFWNEPLEQESELWDMPNVVMTTHQAAQRSTGRGAQASKIFEENLDRFLSGMPLINVVDASAGY